MNVWTRRAIAIPLAVGGMLILLVATAAYMLHNHYQHLRGTLEPRLERLLGIIHAASDIQASLSQAVQQLGPWVHPASTNPATDVQKLLRQMVDAAGLTTVALQAVEPTTEPTLTRIRLSATVAGSWASTVLLLRVLEQQRPALWVQSFSIQRDGRDMPNEPQIVRLVLQIEAPVAQEAKP